MANNRIYLRCKCCGKTLFLGKRFSDGYYLNERCDISFIDLINEFYDNHAFCRGQGLDCFEIEYEMKENYDFQTSSGEATDGNES